MSNIHRRYQQVSKIAKSKPEKQDKKSAVLADPKVAKAVAPAAKMLEEKTPPKAKPERPAIKKTDGKDTITLQIDADLRKAMKAFGRRWDIEAVKILREHFVDRPTVSVSPPKDR